MLHATRLLSFCVLLVSFCLSTALAVATPTDAVPDPTSTACADIVNSNGKRLILDISDLNLIPLDRVFVASEVKACLLSIPFHADVATRFLAYYTDTLKFHSTLGYLKDPPAGYQQPAIDLIGGLKNIQTGIDNGVYINQYQFEIAVKRIIHSAHDDHLELVTGILGAFTFGAPLDIASVSLDGIELPKPYVYGNLTPRTSVAW